MKKDIKITRYAGDSWKEQIDLLAKYRQRYFQEFPHLYKGTDVYTRALFDNYMDDPATELLVASDDEMIMGMALGTSTAGHKVYIHDAYPLAEEFGIDLGSFYLFAELIISSRYTRLGVADLIIEAMRVIAHEHGLSRLCLLTTFRPADDPRRPVDHIEHETLLEQIGFEKSPISIIHYWPTIQYDNSVAREGNQRDLWVDKA